MKQITDILFVFGTRPEAIKLAPLILMAKKDPRFRVTVCSTGQHREMLRSILPLFQIRVDLDLDIMAAGQSLTDVAIAVMRGMREIIEQKKPDVIVVQGDTTTCFAASVVGFQEKVPVVHVEAGLRSGDLLSPFPEEFNRRVTAQAASLHFAPTDGARANLLLEGISEDRIFVTGNTGIDALMEVRKKLCADVGVRAQLNEQFSYLNPDKKLILVTCHRRESFGEPMEQIMRGVLQSADRSNLEFLIPLHMNPNVRRSATQVFHGRSQWARSEAPARHNIWLTDPVSYLQFVYLMERAHIIVTDSGGVQEEAPTFGKPILVAREKTERPEAIAAGTSVLVPLQADAFAELLGRVLDDSEMYQKMAQAKNPFGDGHACDRIMQIVGEQLSLEKAASGWSAAL